MSLLPNCLLGISDNDRAQKLCNFSADLMIYAHLYPKSSIGMFIPPFFGKKHKILSSFPTAWKKHLRNTLPESERQLYTTLFVLMFLGQQVLFITGKARLLVKFLCITVLPVSMYIYHICAVTMAARRRGQIPWK